MLDIDKIFREYDIREVVGKDLDEGFAFSLGKAFGSLLKKVNAGAKDVLRRRPCTVIIGDVRCSQWMFDCLMI